MSIKALGDNFMANEVKFVGRIQEDGKWKFEELKEGSKRLREFEDWFIQQKAKEYGVNPEELVILNIAKGSIIVQFASINCDDQAAIIRQNEKNKKLEVHPYFQHFQLSEEDFDPKGNREFPKEVSFCTRGGWPYLIPVNCTRFGK